MYMPYNPLSREQVARRKPIWDCLASRKAYGRAALCDCPKPDAAEIRRALPLEDKIMLTGPAGKNPEWDRELRRQIVELHVAALSRVQDDSYPAISIPRIVYGQSQALAELFGCRLIPQQTEPGLYYPVPRITMPSDLAGLKTVPVERCLYGKALEFAKYAFDATDGVLAVRNPVMTGPIDCANYILGSMLLMQWIYDEPAALHRLLAMITDVLITLVVQLQRAAGNKLCPDHCVCLDHGFALCSEVRSMLSKEAYLEYEAPYLRQIGRACGPYMIHSCGSWERTLPSDIQDSSLMMVNFQVREMDLKKVMEHTGGALSLCVGRSINLDERYTWPDEASFHRHLMLSMQEPVPLAFSVFDLDGYHEALRDTEGGPSGLFRQLHDECG